MINKIFRKNKIAVLVLILCLISAPMLSSAAPLVSQDCGKIVDGKLKECVFKDLMGLLNRVINFVFVSLALPIAAIMFVYAGFLMIVPGGESASKRGKAKGIFFNAVIGLLLAAGSWLIVHTLLSILGYDGSWIGF